MPAGPSGIGVRVREHLLAVFALARLGASDRAALQSLIPLASGLGAGTIFGLFFVGRRRAGYAVFEAIAIVAVLASVAATSYYAISLLHRDEAITNAELVETSVPLIVAAVLLIAISIVARLRGATQRLTALLPLVLVAVVAVIEIAGSGVWIDPDAAPVVALVILAAGAGFGVVGTVIDRRARQTARRAEHDRLALLTGRGYVLAEARLSAALPRLAGEDGPPPLDIWRRGEDAFVDAPAAARLREAVDARWSALAAGEARAPAMTASGGALLEIEGVGGSHRTAPTELRLATLRPGADPPRQTATLVANADGLFDVTDLVA